MEEAWFRLFLVTLCYFLLRPAFSKRPAIALGCAVLFSAITFGLGQATRLDRLVISWPSGVEQELRDLETNRILEITEPAPGL